MELSYYPGCSASATGKEYDLSTRAVLDALGVELRELDDWNCCAASSAHVTSRTLSLAMPARNLAIAQEHALDMLTPCAACYARHKAADYHMRHEPETRAEIERVAGFTYTGQVRVVPPIGLIAQQVGLERVRSMVTNPLRGHRVVGYYGCLLVRPPEVMEFDDPEHPVLLNRLLEALGADVKEWSYATDCCGGGLTLTRSDIASRLVGRLVRFAREAGADAIVTACPLCQMSLEMRQMEKTKMPVVYFTELMGLAFGLPDVHRWWRMHLIDPRPWLQSAG